jgi:hypothetical protein
MLLLKVLHFGKWSHFQGCDLGIRLTELKIKKKIVRGVSLRAEIWMWKSRTWRRSENMRQKCFRNKRIFKVYYMMLIKHKYTFLATDVVAVTVTDIPSFHTHISAASMHSKILRIYHTIFGLESLLINVRWEDWDGGITAVNSYNMVLFNSNHIIAANWKKSHRKHWCNSKWSSNRQLNVWSLTLVKGKAFPLLGWTGPWGSRRLRVQNF